MLKMRAAALASALVMLLGACSQQTSTPQGVETPGVSVIVASYDLAVGPKGRFLVGLIDKDHAPVSGGQVQMRFKPVKGGESLTATGSFLQIPKQADGHDHAHGEAEHGHLPEGFGVYAAQVAFPTAGDWKVTVESKAGSGEAAFTVNDEHKIPFVGDPAIPSDNLTMSSTVEPVAIDSRAQEGPVPDPSLHQTTIKSAIEVGKPALVVFSTPVWCLSRFCGPVTDVVLGLSQDYSDRAVFIHIEIWKDRQGQVINEAAAEWLLRDGDLQEPWVFLIGGDGTILARWDNVATRDEVEPELQKLPAV